MATESHRGCVLAWPFVVTETELSAITPGADIDLEHNGPSGAKPFKVEHEVIERPTSRDAVSFEHDRENDSTTNDTVRVSVDTTPGGSLIGAVVLVRTFFVEQASGGTTVS